MLFRGNQCQGKGFYIRPLHLLSRQRMGPIYAAGSLVNKITENGDGSARDRRSEPYHNPTLSRSTVTMNLMSDIDTKEASAAALDSDQLWYKDAIIYQLHVKAFADSNNDGIGDFAGLTEKLDYLQDLGVTTLWLLPFFPSPGRDDGYDIADYGAVNPDFGTMKDFRRFIVE